MSLEGAQNYLYPIIDLFSITAALFGLLVVYKLVKKEYKPDIKKSMILLFLLLTIGYIFYACAEVLWSALDFIYGEFPVGGIPDLLWVIGYFFIFAALVYFAVFMYKSHGNLKKGLTIMSIVALISAIVVYYLISRFIFGFQQEESSLEILLDYFYPIMSAIILTASVNIYIFFRKLEVFGTPLLYLAIANLINFFGDMLYTYYIWNDIYGIPGVLSDILYLISYIIITYAFYVLFRSISLEKKAS